MIPPKMKSRSASHLSAAWSDFSRMLGAVLAQLQEDQYLILMVKQSDHYVQFAAQGSFGMRAETTGNAYLPKGRKLAPGQIRAMARMGWHKPTGKPAAATPERDPTGSPNLYIDFAVPVSWDAVSALAVSTLSEILEIPHPGNLTYQAFDKEGNSFALPELGLKRTPSSSEGEQKVRECLLAVLTEMTGLNGLEFDKDSDIAIVYGSAQLYVRLIDDAEFILIHSPILRDVKESMKAFRRINEVNAENALLHLVLRNGRVYGLSVIPVKPFVADLVASTFLKCSQLADVMGSQLQSEGFGQAAYKESMPSATRH